MPDDIEKAINFTEPEGHLTETSCQQWIWIALIIHFGAFIGFKHEILAKANGVGLSKLSQYFKRHGLAGDYKLIIQDMRALSVQ